MTETRTPQAKPRQPQNSPSEATEAEIAAAIALILAGQVVVVSAVGAIAALLALIPDLPEDDVSTPVARMVSRIGRDTPNALEGNLRANASNLSYRAHYAIEATKRIAGKVKNGDALRDALSAERTYLRQHLEASEVRTNGAALNEAAARRFGPLLGWVHTGRTHTHRPSHVAANGANYRIDRPPQATEGMLPGQALHCDCVPGPPFPNGRMLA